jgi:hypothetical protein
MNRTQTFDRPGFPINLPPSSFDAGADRPGFPLNLPPSNSKGRK